MKASHVAEYLLSLGCSPANFAVGKRGGVSDAFCLQEHEGRWNIFYTERGVDSTPSYSSLSEEDACEKFIQRVLSLEHWHMVGIVESAAAADSLSEKIRALGAAPIRNDIPNFTKTGDRRYRVFVKGKDILRVQHLIKTDHTS